MKTELISGSQSEENIQRAAAPFLWEAGPASLVAREPCSMSTSGPTSALGDYQMKTLQSECLMLLIKEQAPKSGLSWPLAEQIYVLPASKSWASMHLAALGNQDSDTKQSPLPFPWDISASASVRGLSWFQSSLCGLVSPFFWNAADITCEVPYPTTRIHNISHNFIILAPQELFASRQTPWTAI